VVAAAAAEAVLPVALGLVQVVARRARQAPARQAVVRLAAARLAGQRSAAARRGLLRSAAHLESDQWAGPAWRR
jgi:hypothetical protein